MAIGQVMLISGITGASKPKARQGCTIMMREVGHYRSISPLVAQLDMFNGTDTHRGSVRSRLGRSFG